MIGAVYPNPASSSESIIIPVTLASNALLTIEITDLNGRKISEIIQTNAIAGLHNISIQLPALSAGTYLVKVSREDGIFATRRLVIK